MPVIADATYAELWEKALRQLTNYARQFLGSHPCPSPRARPSSYQCTHEVGKDGQATSPTAIALGTIKHPELAVTENPLVHLCSHRSAHPPRLTTT